MSPKDLDQKSLAVFCDAERHTCIKIFKDRKGVHFIPFNARISLELLSAAEFEDRYKIKLDGYAVEEAAQLYLNATWLEISEEAKKYLSVISKFKSTIKKEIIMATAKPKVKKAPTKASAPAKKTTPVKKTPTKVEAPAKKPAAKVSAPAKKPETKAEKTAKELTAGRRATDPVVKAAPDLGVKAAPDLGVKAANTPSKEQRAHRSKFQDTARITVVAKENPYREGTKAHSTFELFAKSATVGEFKKLAVDMEKFDPSYLTYSNRDGYIKVV